MTRSHRVGGSNVRRIVLAAAGSLAFITAAPAVADASAATSPAAAPAAPGPVTVTATINGRDLASVDANTPIVLRPSGSADVDVMVSNTGSTPVTVRSVRVEGRFVGLAFYSFDTRVDLDVPAGDSGERSYSLDLGDLGSQATGLLPSSLQLIAPDRHVLAKQTFPVDVKGKVLSVYGSFGLAIIGITLLMLGAGLFRLVRQTLSDNRWSRALRFAIPGLGVGLSLTFGLSSLRAALPNTHLWLPLIIGGGVVGFVLGYLTPTPHDAAREAAEEVEEAHEAAEIAGIDLVRGGRSPAGSAATGSRQPTLIDLRETRPASSAEPPPPPRMS